MTMKLKKPVAADVTVKMAADTAATSNANSNPRCSTRNVNKATKSAPPIPAALRFTTSFDAGSPHRARGPASASCKGAAPPPNARAHTNAATALTIRMKSALTRYTFQRRLCKDGRRVESGDPTVTGG